MDNIRPQILSRRVSGVIMLEKFNFFLNLVIYQCLVEIVTFK